MDRRYSIVRLLAFLFPIIVLSLRCFAFIKLDILGMAFGGIWAFWAFFAIGHGLSNIMINTRRIRIGIRIFAYTDCSLDHVQISNPRLLELEFSFDQCCVPDNGLFESDVAI